MKSSIARTLKRLVYLYGPLDRRCCLKCGFLTFDGGEARGNVRRKVSGGRGTSTWFEKEDAVDCFKGLWHRDDGAAVDAIFLGSAGECGDSRAPG
jgi:hypothetical protein